MIPSLSRRSLLLGLGASGLAGCAPGSTVDLFTKTLASKPAHPGRYPLSNEQIDAIPYATLGVKLGPAPAAIVVLATIDGDDLHWASADRVHLVTRKGRLIQTHGLKRDLVATEWAAEDTLQKLSQKDLSVIGVPIVTRFIDLNRNKEAHLAIESTFIKPTEEMLPTLYGSRRALRVTEHVVVHRWRWETFNTFWIDAETGSTLKSSQQYCPEIAYMEIETLKPARVSSV